MYLYGFVSLFVLMWEEDITSLTCCVVTLSLGYSECLFLRSTRDVEVILIAQSVVGGQSGEYKNRIYKKVCQNNSQLLIQTF